VGECGYWLASPFNLVLSGVNGSAEQHNLQLYYIKSEKVHCAGFFLYCWPRSNFAVIFTDWNGS